MIYPLFGWPARPARLFAPGRDLPGASGGAAGGQNRHALRRSGAGAAVDVWGAPAPTDPI